MAQLVLDFLGRLGLGGSADRLALLHGLLVDGGHLGHHHDWDLGNFLRSGALNPRSTVKANFRRLFVAFEQVVVPKRSTMADVVDAAEAQLKSQQK